MRPATLLFCALAALASAPSAFAQDQSKAYAPRDLAVLNEADRTRVIEREYGEQSGGRSIPDDQLEFYLDQIDSGWTWQAIQNDIAQSLAGSGGWHPAPPPRPVPAPRPEPLPPPEPIGSIYGPGAVELDCESRKYRYTTCRTGVRARFEIIGQYGKSPCVEGRSWGQSPGVIWVDQGCRARFVEQQYYSRPWRGTTFDCAAADAGYRECRIPGDGPVRVMQELGRGRCVEGRTWGQRSGWVWVDAGCRARFERVDSGRPGGRPSRDRYDDEPYAVTCTSRGEYRTCAWDPTEGEPTLIENLSRDRCVEGRTWGYDRRQGLWVDEGCQGRFGTID